MRIFGILLLITILIEDTYSQEAHAKWMGNNITVDGVAAEWGKPLSFYDFTSKVSYAIGNNHDTLFLCFTSPEEKVARLMAFGGTKITLTIKSKPKHSVSITFPVKQEAAEKSDNATTDSTGKSFYDNTHTYMQLEGLAFTNGIQPIVQTSGIKIAAANDNKGQWAYELAIPFKELYGENYSPNDLEKEIFMNVLLLEKSHGGMYPRKNIPGGEAGYTKGQGTGRHGSTHTGGDKEQNENAMFLPPESKSFKQEFFLTKQQ